MLVEGNIDTSSCCSAFELGYKFCQERPHSVIGSVAETYTKDLINCS